MVHHYHDSLADVYHGHALDVLRGLPAESVQCVATSPPYWGLRDYGLPPMVWGGVDGCVHEWGEEKVGGEGYKGRSRWQHGIIGDGRPNERGENYQQELRATGELAKGNVSQGTFCRYCGAWRGSLGLEPTPDLFIAHLVEVFREVRRVLRSDGLVFINLGDSYCSAQGGRQSAVGEMPKKPLRMEKGPKSRKDVDVGGWSDRDATVKTTPTAASGLKPKDLCGIPWRVALALQADGWWLRSDIIWSKPNPMPESCTDRPTKSHEYVFLLTKSARYFWDQEAVREKGEGYGRGTDPHGKMYARLGLNAEHCKGGKGHSYEGGRNIRSVWTIATAPYPQAHFATFPPALVVPMIRAGTSERGCCPACGTPWVRVVEKGSSSWEARKAAGHIGGIGGSVKLQKVHGGTHDFDNKAGGFGTPASSTTLGWQPGCECPEAEPVPCTVLDPFHGAGTTGAVAKYLGRRYIGIELSAEYIDMSLPRLRHPGESLGFVDTKTPKTVPSADGQKELF